MILKEWYETAKKNGIVYVVCEHVATNGMSARYNFYTIHNGELEIAWPSVAIPTATDKSAWDYSEPLADKLHFVNKKRGNTHIQAFERKGAGYDRAFDILGDIARECDGLKGDASKIRIVRLNRS